MVPFAKKENCCGCGACAVSCPTKAIHMVPDEFGFAYPEIDDARCIHCGKCKAVCPFGAMEQAGTSRSRYLAKANDTDVCMSSTSGGMYTAFSDAILKEGGVIYAADLLPDLSVQHIRITNTAQRDHSRGSKYVQSQVHSVYEALCRDLSEQRKVLFVGTPCQVAAVRQVAAKYDYSNLYTADLICNGVGSPAIWQQHVKRLETHFGKAVSFYVFRPKNQGYLTSSEVCYFADGTAKELQRTLNKYNTLYYNALIHRPSCTACKYACSARVGDITIGDFAQATVLFPDFDASNGASLLLINTDKGNALFEQVRSFMTCKPVDADACDQVRLHACCSANPHSTPFMTNSMQHGLEKAIRAEFPFHKRLRFLISAWIRGAKQ